MKSPISESTPTEEVIEQAVLHLLKLINGGSIPIPMFCTSLQNIELNEKDCCIHLKCYESENDPDNVAYCAFECLLKEMSQSKTYAYVKNSLEKCTTDEKNLINRLLHYDISQKTESDSDLDCSEHPCCHTSAQKAKWKIEQKNCQHDLAVYPEHVMTLYLLVWFDNTLWNKVTQDKLFEDSVLAGSGQTFNDHLKGFFKMDLESSTGVFLTSEIKSLRNKFEETMKYHEFDRLSCCQKKKCCQPK